jgi:hypothetical protein
MNKLTASDIRIILLELDVAVKHRDHRDIHTKSINAVRDMLLRAALSDVTVEQERAA